jgi:hypothetical protein
MKNFKSFLTYVSGFFLAVNLYANSTEWDSQILLEHPNDGYPWIDKLEMLSESSTNGFNVKFILTTITADRSWLEDKYASIEEDTVTLQLLIECGDATIVTTLIDTFNMGELQIGTYFLHVKVYSTCGNNEATTNFNLGVSLLNMDRDANEILHIYPNPSTDYLIIESSGNKTIGNIEILDSKGSLVRNCFSDQGKIEIGDLPNGIYLVKFHFGDLIESRKIIIRK